MLWALHPLSSQTHNPPTLTRLCCFLKDDFPFNAADLYLSARKECYSQLFWDILESRLAHDCYVVRFEMCECGKEARTVTHNVMFLEKTVNQIPE